MKLTKFSRFLLVALALAMVFSLFACGETPTETTVAEKEETTAKPIENDTDSAEKTTEATTAEKAETVTTAADSTDSSEATTEETDDTTDTTESATESDTESDSATESESAEATTESETETDAEEVTTEAKNPDDGGEDECAHEECYVNKNCDYVCFECNEVVEAKKHIKFIDKDDNCNLKCKQCKEVFETEKHVEGQPDPENGCKISCTGSVSL